MPLGSSPLHQLGAVVAVTLVLRRLDEHDPRAVLAARALFVLHTVFFAVLSVLSVRSIVHAHDHRRCLTPPGATGDTARSQTVHEHDLRALWSRTRSWLLNALVLCALHVRADTLAPLVISSIIGSVTLWADDITCAHVRGVQPRTRPWSETSGPLGALLACVRGSSRKDAEAKEAQHRRGDVGDLKTE